MRTINIVVSVTEREHQLLRLGKCDKPSAQKLKVLLLREAAGNLRRFSDEVLSTMHVQPKAAAHAKPRRAKRLPTANKANGKSVPSQARSVPSQARSVPSQARSVPSQARSVPSQARSVPSQARYEPTPLDEYEF